MSAAVPSQPAQPPSDTPAQAVGNQFVSQYYTVQHASPKHLHRFYSDASTLTYGEVRPEGFLAKQATGQKTIHDLVMELGYEDTSTEIYTVDSQYSLGGGVVVQVTGIMQRPGGPKRPFVQTFFLAVQEKGYFVLNDIFRYLPLVPATPDNGGGAIATAPAAAPPPPGSPQPLPASAPPAPPPPAAAAPAAPPPAAATPAAVTAQQLALQQMSLQPGSEQHNGVRAPVPPVAVQYTAYVSPGMGPIPPPPQQPPIPVPLPAAMMPGVVAPPPVAVPPPRVPPPPAAGGAVPPPPRTQQPPKPAPGGEPLSYAERLRQGGKASAPGSPTKAAGAAAPSAAPPPPPAEEPAEPARQQAAQHAAAAEAVPFEEQPNASIFVRGIPASVSMAQLVERLGQFGRLRPQGVILKTQKGRDSFAFIDFEEPAPAQLLLREGLEIEGARVDVQPKRPLIFRPAPHGGRGDGGRGGANGGEGGRGGRYDGPPGGRGGFRGFRGGRGPYPGPPQAADGRPVAMGGPMGGRGMGPPPGAIMPPPVPMGPMPGRGYGPEAYGGCRGYGGGRGRGRGGPPPPQQQPPPPAAAPAPAPAPQPAAE